MSRGVLIKISISEQHDEIDITPAQLHLNSLYYLTLIIQKKWNISLMPALNLFPALSWPFWLRFLKLLSINYIYFYNYAQIRCIVFITKSKPLLPCSAKDNTWERNPPPGDQIKTFGTPKRQYTYKADKVRSFSWISCCGNTRKRLNSLFLWLILKNNCFLSF